MRRTVNFRAYIFQRPLRGLCTEGNLRFKNRLNWLAVGRKFTIFALLLYFVFEGKFRDPQGGLILRGAIRVFCVTSLEGLYLEGLLH